MAEPVLELRGLRYRYPKSTGAALDGLTLTIAPGEFVLLGGASGSGKTSLLRAACGLVPHFHGGEIGGEVTVAGRSTRDHGPAELATVVGFVSQEPESQVVSTTVAAELGLPLELRGFAAGERGRAVEEVALALGIEHLLARTTDSLSGGELQRVAIGAAIATRPPLLLLDEPTSQLDPVAGDELISLLRRLNEEWGVAVLVGEHRIERCLAAADRVLAMRAGTLLYDGDRDDFALVAQERAPELAPAGSRLFALAGRPERPATVKAARAALGGEPDRFEPLGPRPSGFGLERGGAGSGRPALRARRLSVDLGSGASRRRALDDAAVTVGAGERVALMGPNGAGKSTLLRCAAGLLQPAAGAIEAPGGCALLGQRPDDYLVRERVGDELPGAAGEAALAAVGLAVAGGVDPRDLSGGERQRLALAIAMAGRGAGGEPPALVCLDEPTRGLDRLRKEDLASWLVALTARGAATLVATHDVEFAARFAERVVLLARGRVLADGPVEEVLAGGWYFVTETARITGGRAVTPEAGAELLRPALSEGSGR